MDRSRRGAARVGPWATRIAIAAVVLLGLVRHADAQIVNVQSLLADPPKHDGVTGQVELKLEWREGNNPFFDVGGEGSMLIRRGRVLVLALGRAEYGDAAGGVAIARKTFEHLRTRVTLDCRWRWEAFAQHEYDGFRRLSVRAIAGTGPVLQIVGSSRGVVLAGAAYMLEIERLDTRPGTIDAGVGSVASRASFYLTGTEKLGKTGSVVQTVYVQPRLGDPGDVRLLGELAVTSKLSKRFALSDGFTVAYDRTPPDGIKRYDTQLKAGLLVTF